MATYKPKYSDLDLDLIINPRTGDIAKKVDEEAIKRSIRNLIMTNFFEVEFEPYKGADLRKMLFEPISPLTSISIRKAIEDAIGNYEPRIQALEIIVQANEDQNRYDIAIVYAYRNNGNKGVLRFPLERLR